MKNITLDENTNFILNTLEKNGYKAYVVGGCVRDFIMGIEPHDIDISTSATPNEVKELFNKTIDTGIEHGTVTVLVNKEPYEVTTFRIDGDYIDNRKPEHVSYTNDVYEDMLRRDFTVNAIGYNNTDGFVDYFDGFKDIENKIIRGVGDPVKRFTEDALRMIRAIRFSATCNFTIEPNTYEAIILKRELLKNISVERIREEFTKLLMSNNNEKIELFVETKLIKYYREDFYQYLKENILEIKEYLKYSKKNPIYLYSALFHNLSSDETLKQMKYLKWDNNTIKSVSTIVSAFNEKIEKTPYYIRKMISKYGVENTKAILFFKEKIDNTSYETQLNEVNITLENKYPTDVKGLNINGDDLKNIGITNGKEIGNCLKYLLDIALINPEINEKELLIEQCKNYLNSSNK